MYEYIKGIFKGMNKEYVVVENNDIGYCLYASGNTISNMPDVEGQVQLFIQQIVRDDFIGLYGFYTKEERDMFNLLLTINGIGAKAALSLLSISSINNLKYAILTSDIKTLMKAPGVGKKTAQRIILELKDKFKDNEALQPMDVISDNSKNSYDEALAALIALGYSEKEATKALESVNVVDSLEDVIKQCLKYLMN